MTTSPFGSPSTFGAGNPGAPAAPAAADAPSGRSRKPLLLAVGGVAAVAAVGAGAFFLLAPDAEPADVVTAPRGTATAPVPEPTETEAPPAQLVTQSSRNPFAALVVEGGAGASSTVPETSTASSGAGTSSSGSSAGSAGSSSGGSSGSSGGGASVATPGPAGPAGPAGKDGKDGRNGANGTDGLTPLFVTIQVVDVDEVTNTVDAVVRTTAGETTPIDLPVGSPFDAEPETVAGQVVYTAVGTDLDTDGQIDFVTVTVNGVDYTTHVGETFVGFVYQ